MTGEQATLPGIGYDTLSQARIDLRAKLKDGTHCPCCGKYCRTYRRTLNKAQARALLWMARVAGPDGWVYMPSMAPKWITKANQHSTMKHWRLVDTRPTDDPERKGSGWWRVTALGHAWLSGSLKVPRQVFEYNDQCVGRSDDEVEFFDVLCIGDFFRYDELMSADLDAILGASL